MNHSTSGLEPDDIRDCIVHADTGIAGDGLARINGGRQKDALLKLEQPVVTK